MTYEEYIREEYKQLRREFQDADGYDSFRLFVLEHFHVPEKRQHMVLSNASRPDYIFEMTDPESLLNSSDILKDIVFWAAFYDLNNVPENGTHAGHSR